MEAREEGEDEEKRELKQTNTVSVNTFLFPPLGSAVEDESEHSNRTEAVRGAVDGKNFCVSKQWFKVVRHPNYVQGTASSPSTNKGVRLVSVSGKPCVRIFQ